jgi:hypothetical protein
VRDRLEHREAAHAAEPELDFTWMSLMTSGEKIWL